MAGRSVGGWTTVRRLRTVQQPSWEHISLLYGTLHQIGVKDEAIGPTVKLILSTDPNVDTLNDPVRILSLIPEEAFKASSEEKDPKSSLPSVEQRWSEDIEYPSPSDQSS
jgi:hypothetical protein